MRETYWEIFIGGIRHIMAWNTHIKNTIIFLENIVGNHVGNFVLQGCDRECFEPLLNLHSHLVLGTLVINPLTLNLLTIKYNVKLIFWIPIHTYDIKMLTNYLLNLNIFSLSFTFDNGKSFLHVIFFITLCRW
jgi:hypothetical protein